MAWEPALQTWTSGGNKDEPLAKINTKSCCFVHFTCNGDLPTR